jgi:hypothetical protein
VQALMRMLQSGTISAAEAAAEAQELFQQVEDKTESSVLPNVDNSDKRQRKVYPQKGRGRMLPYVDGMGAWGRDAWNKCQWVDYSVTGAGADNPHTYEGACAWLKKATNTHGYATVQVSSNTHSVVRRCVSCPAQLVQGIERKCGVMWRMDASNGWEPRVRAASDGWDGEHVGTAVEAGGMTVEKRRKNSAFPADVQAKIEKRLQDGEKPKKIFNTLVNERYDARTEAERSQMCGKEAVAQAMGFSFLQVRSFAARMRRQLGNGFYVESLCELKVCSSTVAL